MWMIQHIQITMLVMTFLKNENESKIGWEIQYSIFLICKNGFFPQ